MPFSITVLIWKKACINLFITYFNIELKKTKLTFLCLDFHIFYERVSFCLRNTNKSFLAGHRHFPNDNWQLGGSDVIGLTRGLISCYQSFSPISAHGLISLWYFRCLRMGKIDVITYKYVINDLNCCLLLSLVLYISFMRKYLLYQEVILFLYFHKAISHYYLSDTFFSLIIETINEKLKINVY